MQHTMRLTLAKTTATALLFTILTAVLGSVLTASPSASAASTVSAANPPALKALGNFEATIYQGPDKGLSLTGVLKLRATKEGHLIGRLVPKRGAAIPVSGQITGLAIHLVFYVPGSKQLFGVGTIGVVPSTQRMVIGGPLVGPRGGDSGDWFVGTTCYYINGINGQPLCRLCVPIFSPPGSQYCIFYGG